MLKAGDRQLLDCGFDSPQILSKPYNFYTSFVSGGVLVGGSQGVAFQEGAAAFPRGNRFCISSPFQEDRKKLALRARCYSEFEQGHLDAALGGDSHLTHISQAVALSIKLRLQGPEEGASMMGSISHPQAYENCD